VSGLADRSFFFYLICSVSDQEVRLMLWDTAGQEEFDCITRAYYRGAQVCVLAFSCVDKDSFKQVVRWKNKVEEECGSIPMVLVMTKMDLLYKATVDSFEVEKMSRNLGLHLVRTSVKENLNVDKVFLHLAAQHLSELSQWNKDPPLIQIGGGGGFSGFSQTDFLTRYERNMELEQKGKKRKVVGMKSVKLCDNSYNFMDTRAFFLSPVRKKSLPQKTELRSVCKIL